VETRGLFDTNLPPRELGNFTFVDFDLISKELVLLDKLLLQVGQTVVLLCQASLLLDDLLSLGIQELLSLPMEGSEAF